MNIKFVYTLILLLLTTFCLYAKKEKETGITDVLKNLDGQLSFQVWQYDKNKVNQKHVFSVNGTDELKIENSRWKCSVDQFKVLPDSAFELSTTFCLVNGNLKSSGIAVTFDFKNWSASNYILVPAMIYGGNRFRILDQSYPPYIHDEKDKPLDMPVTTTNILHFNSDGSHAKVEMNTGNIATPMFSYFNPDKNKGFILLFEQGTQFGNNGMILEEDAGPGTLDKRFSFALTAPCVRYEKYVGCGGRAKSGDIPHDWKAGDKITMKLKLYQFSVQDIKEFYSKVFEVRKGLSGANNYDCVTPYSVAANLIVEHHNKDKWHEQGKTAFYCNHPGSSEPYAYQIVNYMPFTFPELILETPERLHRSDLTIDYVLRGTQGKTGLFHAMKMNMGGEFYGDEFGKTKEKPDIAMTRTSMDVLYFGIQSFDLLEKRNHSDLIKPEWRSSLKKCADGLVSIWNEYGQFGQFIDVESGKMDINGSTSGCTAGSALALASQYFNEPKYLKVAEDATKMYYERDFLKGYAGGGASEILQSPDSEAPWDMAESCIVLYSITGKEKWLEMAKYAVHMLSTWMVSYDYKFPEGSLMQKAGTHAAGSIFASSQNNHSAPGYYILSGDFMLKLFRATGDKRFAEMYKDQSHNVVQYIGAPYNPLRKESGFVTERVQLSDWEDGLKVGDVSTFDSNMAWETLAALTCLQNPGIYLHTDDDTFLVLDHVEANIVKRDKNHLVIKIHNPTNYDAQISVFAETLAQSKKPMKLNSFLSWPKVEVKAGATKEFIIKKDGSVI